MADLRYTQNNLFFDYKIHYTHTQSNAFPFVVRFLDCFERFCCACFLNLYFIHQHACETITIIPRTHTRTFHDHHPLPKKRDNLICKCFTRKYIYTKYTPL